MATPLRTRQDLEALTAGLAKDDPGFPEIREVLRTFLRRWTQQAGQGDLELESFTSAEAAADAGKEIYGSAARVYALVAWKLDQNGNDTFIHLYDDTATPFDTAGSARVGLGLTEDDSSALAFYPKGLRMASGIGVAAQTALNGTTADAAVDSPRGFVIYQKG